MHSVKEGDLAKWLAVGWVESQWRDRRPSVDEDIVVIEWSGVGDPPWPHVREPLRAVEDAMQRLVLLTERLDRDHRTSEVAFIVGDARRLLSRVQVYASKLFNGEVGNGS